MKKFNKQHNIKYSSGFTIIEAMIAIFILSVSVASMLGVNATSASFSRYANNELTANYLAQEAIDSIRNSRDTIAFQQKEDGDTGVAWTNFLNRYGYKNGDKCFNNLNGCDLKMEEFDPADRDGGDVVLCPDGGCPLLKYDTNPSDPSVFYKTIGNSDSIFRRKVTMEMAKDTNGDPKDYEVKIVVDVSWDNTGNGSMKSRTLEMYLLNWKN